MHTELSDRSQRVLAAVVAEYIENGEAVSSLMLARRGRGAIGVSSATVRGILSDLEQRGYIRQPHTSGGRVPTDAGYRYYVDRLLLLRRPARSTSAVEAHLRRQADTVDQMLLGASHLLSRRSRHIAFALAPDPMSEAFRQIEFLPLAGSKILVVLVSRGGQISRKVIDVGEAASHEDLRHATNYLNAELSGRSVRDARAAVELQLRQERILYDRLLERTLRLACSVFDQISPDSAVFVEGTASLVDELSSGERPVSLTTLRALLNMVEEKEQLVRLLHEYVHGPGMTIVIGAEHSSPELREVSLVASTYGEANGLGAVGVIGPTRMHYSKAIAMVHDAAQAMTRVLQGTC